MMEHSSWRRDRDGAVVLTLHVQPGAGRSEFAGMYGDALKLRLAAPPIEGKANAELIRFLRTCETPAQSFEFQRLLFAEIYRIEERGAECNRVRKRLKACELTSREKPISARVYQIAESACRHRWRR